MLGRYFEQLRASARAREFLDGAGPAAIGAILGAAIPLALALSEPWQIALAVVAGAALFARAALSSCSSQPRSPASPAALLNASLPT